MQRQGKVVIVINSLVQFSSSIIMIRQLSRLSGGGGSCGSNSNNNNKEGLDGREVAIDNPNDHRPLLERLVQSQDASISSMEEKQELAALQKEIEEERLKQMEAAILHCLEALERDMQDKDAINKYANLIKGVAPKSGVDSQYVMKLQSQLVKAVKKMDSTSQQMKLVRVAMKW